MAGGVGPGAGVLIELADDAEKVEMGAKATADREAAIANFREVINTPGVTPEEIVLAATELKQALGSVAALIDVIKSLTEEEKRIIERSFQGG
jgi:hypothetical protein